MSHMCSCTGISIPMGIMDFIDIGYCKSLWNFLFTLWKVIRIPTLWWNMVLFFIYLTYNLSLSIVWGSIKPISWAILSYILKTWGVTILISSINYWTNLSIILKILMWLRTVGDSLAFATRYEPTTSRVKWGEPWSISLTMSMSFTSIFSSTNNCQIYCLCSYYLHMH